jgi:DNA-binding SARP family transcriptional activator/ABC-type transport system substrate-binding protein/streptogramin lyase
MEFRILGPLEVTSDTGDVPLGGVQKRAVLALLLLHANEALSVDRLVEELWAESPPKTAAKTVRVYVSQLRKALDGDGRLETSGRGYVLRLDRDDLDAARFDALLTEGRNLLAAGQNTGAAEVLREALALWRGPPLADFSYEPFAQPAIARLEEHRLMCLEERVEADLALGRHEDVVAELEALVSDHPLRERLRGQLMLALYRSGRQAEALEVYRSARRTLSEELGLEPGPGLQALERKILNQDPLLAAPARKTGPAGTRRRGRPWLLVGAGALVLTAALAAVLVEAVGGDEPKLTSIAGNAVGVVDPETNRLVAQIPVERTPTAIVSGLDAIWVVNADDATVSKIDPDKSGVVDSIAVGASPGGIAIGGGTIWVTNTFDGTVSRIDPATGTPVEIPAGNSPTGVASGFGSIWVAASTDGTVRRINAGNGVPQSTIAVGPGVRGIAVGLGSVWVTGSSRGGLLGIDPETNLVNHVVPFVGNGPAAVAVGFRSIWVVNSLDGTVSRVDPRTNAIVATIPIGSGVSGLVVGKDAVWVSDEYSGTLSRIDPDENVVTDRKPVGDRPAGLALGAGRVYVAVRGPRSAHRGGTLTVLRSLPEPSSGLFSIDPARAYVGWEWLTLTSDGLVAYRRTGGSDGLQLVPDLATSRPAPTDRGRTYTFRLLAGIRYSTGAPLRASDFRRGITRSLLVPDGIGPTYLRTIVGAARCIEHHRGCDLARGIETDDGAGTVTFHLTRSDPEFLHKLALPFAFAVPAGTARGDIGMRPVPATGPYMVASASPWRVELVRNPRFDEWSRAAKPDGYPDRIVMLYGAAQDKRVRMVERGVADVTGLESWQLAGVRARFPSQIRLDTSPTQTNYIFLNTRLPPFDRAGVRRAVNLAVDRNELVRLFGGAAVALPTCQALPPSFPAYSPYCPYAKRRRDGAIGGPKIAEARRLVARSGTRGMRVEVWAWAECCKPQLQYLVSVLRELGFDARGQLRTDFDLLRPDVQAGFAGWYADYPSPGGFFDAWLTCDSYTPGASGNQRNPGGFCDPAIDRQIRQASEARDPEAANALWSEIDRRIVDQAPIVPIANPHNPSFVSTRIGNFQFHPVWGPLFDQIWVM